MHLNVKTRQEGNRKEQEGAAIDYDLTRAGIELDSTAREMHQTGYKLGQYLNLESEDIAYDVR